MSFIVILLLSTTLALVYYNGSQPPAVVGPNGVVTEYRTVYATTVVTSVSVSYVTTVVTYLQRPVLLSESDVLVPGVGSGNVASFSFNVTRFFNHFTLESYVVSASNQNPTVQFTIGASASGSCKGGNESQDITPFLTQGTTFKIGFTTDSGTDIYISFKIVGS
jgi:hypothetical protein